jgi:hypothetical protein
MALCVDCNEEYSDRRRQLGYPTCLPCGDYHAREVKRAVVPMSKSNYVLITNPTELKQLNPKRMGE